MKKQINIATALVAVSGFSYGEIKINEYLSIEGFVTADYAVVDNDGNIGESNGARESDNYFGVGEVEIDWLFNFDRVSGRIDLQHEDLNQSTTFVEQAFVSYELWDGGTLTAGRYASMLGYEDFERPGLHQYSFAYDLHDIGSNALDSTNLGITPRYNQGLKYTYESDGNMFAVSLQDSAFGDDVNRFGGDDTGSYGLEVASSIQLAEGLRWFTGVAYQDSDQANSEEAMVVNTYLAYESGPLTFGAEVNYGLFDSGIAGVELDVLQGLLVANYAYSESASVTGRISYTEMGVDVDGVVLTDAFDAVKFTIAHKYAFTDNLALVNEVSFVDAEDIAGDDFEAVLGAASLIFTF